MKTPLEIKQDLIQTIVKEAIQNGQKGAWKVNEETGDTRFTWKHLDEIKK